MHVQSLFLVLTAATTGLAAFDRITRLGRLAAWGQSWAGGNALSCSGEDPGGQAFKTTVYYQNQNDRLVELYREESGPWIRGSMNNVLADNNTPLAVVRWFEKNELTV
jgi:hypothetical protein